MSLHYVTGEFTSPAEEAAFLDHKKSEHKKLLGFTLTFCAAFFLLFSLTDWFVMGYGPRFLLAFLARTVVAVTAAGCAWIGCMGNRSVRTMRSAACVAEAVTLAGMMAISALRPAEFPWHAMSLGIIAIVVYLYIPNGFVTALVLNLAATAAFVPLSLYLGGLQLSDAVTMSMLLLLANAFGAVASRRFNMLSRTEFNAQLKLIHAAEIDHLTGCHNRRYLQDTLIAVELKRALRLKHRITVIACDIDHFKRVNDGYGHAIGDEVIRTFAGLLKRATRSGIDSAVRCGGEEFLLVLPGADLEAGVQIAERLRASFAASVIPTGSAKGMVRATASFGVASTAFDAANPELFAALMREADNLLYEAKRAGRNCVRFALHTGTVPASQLNLH